MPLDYASFMIRLWRENDPQSSSPKSDWLSEVDHIQSGGHWTFNTLDELLDFLRIQSRHHFNLTHPIDKETICKQEEVKES